MSPGSASDGAVVYVGARLPALSETFVYREFLGLRGRGHRMIPISIYPPAIGDGADDSLVRLADEARIVYAASSLRHLPVVLLLRPSAFASLVRNCMTSGAGPLSSRLKHFVQGLAGMALGGALRGQEVRHVHAHMANTPATVALYAAEVLRVPFSFTGHAADIFVHRSRLELKLQKATFVVCISHWHSEFYRSIESSQGARLPVIRCSVSVPSEHNPEPGEAIVAVGRLVRKKGFDVLLKAYAQLVGANPAMERLTIIGDGPERGRLINLARALRIEDYVEFAGARMHADVLGAINGCRLFVLPCRTAADGDRDGIPVVLMEAMAAGRPVVAGDLPTIRELLEDGVSGKLVAPDDIGALASAIQSLVDDPALCTSIGRKGWQRVKSEFSDEVNLARLESAIAQAALDRDT